MGLKRLKEALSNAGSCDTPLPGDRLKAQNPRRRDVEVWPY